MFWAIALERDRLSSPGVRGTVLLGEPAARRGEPSQTVCFRRAQSTPHLLRPGAAEKPAQAAQPAASKTSPPGALRPPVLGTASQPGAAPSTAPTPSRACLRQLA